MIPDIMSYIVYQAISSKRSEWVRMLRTVDPNGIEGHGNGKKIMSVRLEFHKVFALVGNLRTSVTIEINSTKMMKFGNVLPQRLMQQS